MEAVARTLEGLVAADEATAAFLASYTTYLRTHARAAADALTRRREATAAAQRKPSAADEETERAAAGQAGDRTGPPGGDRDRHRAGCAAGSSSSRPAAPTRRSSRWATWSGWSAPACRPRPRRRANWTGARPPPPAPAPTRSGRGRRSTDMQAATVARPRAELAGHAAQAGIGWQPADAEPDGLAERAGARVAVRLEAVRAVRAALAEHRKAEQARDLARIALDRAPPRWRGAEQAEQAAAAAVDRAFADAERRSRLVGPARRAAARREQWQDLTQALAQARSGSASRTRRCWRASTTRRPPPPSSRSATSRPRCAPNAPSSPAERDAVAAERDAIAAERDDAPPPYPGRAADRPGAGGAPLWRLVRFAARRRRRPGRGDRGGAGGDRHAGRLGSRRTRHRVPPAARPATTGSWSPEPPVAGRQPRGRP